MRHGAHADALLMVINLRFLDFESSGDAYHAVIVDAVEVLRCLAG